MDHIYVSDSMLKSRERHRHIKPFLHLSCQAKGSQIWELVPKVSGEQPRYT